MGKRKSKTAKQKQAKAAAAATRAKSKASSSAFGVAVHKGGKGRRRDRQASGPIMAAGKGGSGTTALKDQKVKDAQQGQSGNQPRFGSRQFARGLAGHAVGLAKEKEPAGSPSDENAEFDRQYESMRERLYHRTDSGGSGGLSSGGAALAVKLAPATLRLEPRTAEEMVSDAAGRVARGMSEIGGPSCSSGVGASAPAVPMGVVAPPAAPNLLQIMAAKKREEWAAEERRRQEAAQHQGRVGANNPFAALQDEESDGEDEKAKARASSFCFAPPSFSFSSATQATMKGTLAATPTVYDDDPDL